MVLRWFQMAAACWERPEFAVHTGRAALSAAAVGAYIAAAYWFTGSTSFANPVVTVGRIFSDTFAGIAPTSVLFFIAAQLAGGRALAWSGSSSPTPP